jgi:glutamine synthetase
LRGADGAIVFGDDHGRTPLYDSFIAGLLATLTDFTLLYAPNVNSYKRFAPGSFAPTTIAWGTDNRTCAVRLVGHGPSARLENRVPGADVNPYLALAAMLAGGLHGIENSLELSPELTGNAYATGRPTGREERQRRPTSGGRGGSSPHPTLPLTLRDAREAWNGSAIARAAFGDDVVDHYTNMADVELAAFGAAVTDWERRRGFERL